MRRTTATQPAGRKSDKRESMCRVVGDVRSERVHLQIIEKIKDTRRNSREKVSEKMKVVDTVEIMKGCGCVGRQFTSNPKKFVMIVDRRFIDRKQSKENKRYY